MISQARELFCQRARRAAEWKEKGGKVIGYFNSLTPEELIWASGLLPMQILHSSGKITKSGQYLPEFLCAHLKGCLEQALNGELGYVDGVVIAHACEALRGFSGVWNRNVGIRSYFLQAPATSGKEAENYYHEELKLLWDFLGELSGQESSPERLREAIEIYNENRSLMKQFSELRKLPGSPVSGRDVISVVKAGLVIPKDVHNDLLRKLLAWFRESPPVPDGTDKLKFTLFSNTLEESDVVAQVIEELGGRVVSDNFGYGLRYCWEPIKVGSDPLRSLAGHYLKKIPCPGKYPLARIAEELTGMAKSSGSDGIIWITEKFCDPYLFEHPFLVDRIKAEGFRMLSLEAEEAGNLPRLKMKIEAFLESLQENIV